MFYQVKSQFNFEKKIRYFTLRNSLSCTTQELDVTTPYYPMFALLSVKWSLMLNYVLVSPM